MTTKQFILLGPPGVGVEDQAAILAERWQVPHVSFASLLREATREPSEIAAEVRSAMESGEALPDAIAMKLMRRRFEQPDVMLKGWVLDGFPTTQAQATAFDAWLAGIGKPEPSVVYLKAMTGILINRLTQKGSSESPSVIRRRLEAHQEQIAPVLEYYQPRSRLTNINASLSFAEVARELAQLGQEAVGAARLVENEIELDSLLDQEPFLVVDCMASWCGSCKQVTPSIDKLAEAYRDRATVVKIDFDMNRQITKRFGLKGIPAVMFFKQGDRVETLTGVKSYPEYNAALTRLFESQ